MAKKIYLEPGTDAEDFLNALGESYRRDAQRKLAEAEKKALLREQEKNKKRAIINAKKYDEMIKTAGLDQDTAKKEKAINKIKKDRDQLIKGLRYLPISPQEKEQRLDRYIIDYNKQIEAIENAYVNTLEAKAEKYARAVEESIDIQTSLEPTALTEQEIRDLRIATDSKLTKVIKEFETSKELMTEDEFDSMDRNSRLGQSFLDKVDKRIALAKMYFSLTNNSVPLQKAYKEKKNLIPNFKIPENLTLERESSKGRDINTITKKRDQLIYDLQNKNIPEEDKKELLDLYEKDYKKQIDAIEDRKGFKYGAEFTRQGKQYKTPNKLYYNPQQNWEFIQGNNYYLPNLNKWYTLTGENPNKQDSWKVLEEYKETPFRSPLKDIKHYPDPWETDE